MNLVPLLEREKESVECSELFKANSVFPLEVWGMLFPGSIGFIQTKMERLQLTLLLHHHISWAHHHSRVRCSWMMCILVFFMVQVMQKGGGCHLQPHIKRLC